MILKRIAAALGAAILLNASPAIGQTNASKASAVGTWNID
jgi:hypothetical protein